GGGTVLRRLARATRQRQEYPAWKWSADRCRPGLHTPCSFLVAGCVRPDAHRHRRRKYRSGDLECGGPRYQNGSGPGHLGHRYDRLFWLLNRTADYRVARGHGWVAPGDG